MEISRKTFFKKLGIVVAANSIILSGCNKDDESNGSGKGSGTITLTIGSEETYFGIGGKSGSTITIDWGDGSEIEKQTLSNRWESVSVGDDFSHNYSNSSTRTITINGENIETFGFGKNNNKYISLDVSKNPKLISLVFSQTQLTSLDVSKNSKLIWLFCVENQLTSLDVSKNPALISLICWNNQLTSLDVSKNTKLTHLNCDGNQLTNLDMSKNTELTFLDCGGNKLRSLVVSKDMKLTELHCAVNQLSTSALNALFESLPTTEYGMLFIRGNPGTNSCNRSIATNKGWYVDF